MPNSTPESLEGQVFKSENFSKKSLENKAYSNCTFHSCDFSETNLRNTRFSTCIFKNCNLSLMKLEGCRFQDAQFIECKIVGAEFFRCNKTLFSATFKGSLLQYCNFSDLQMKNTSFKGSKLVENHFTNTILTGADFSEVDLSGTTFHNCDLSKANFSSATRYHIDPRTNKIKQARFSLPDAVGLLSGFDITLV